VSTATEIEMELSSPLVMETSGEVLRQKSCHGFEVRESIYPSGLVLEKHSHQHAFLAFIIEGTYIEAYQGTSVTCTEGALRYLPPREIHSNRYDSGARALLVKIQPQMLDRLREHSTVIECPGEVYGTKAKWLAQRLQVEFNEADDVSTLAMEGVLLEILAESGRSFEGRAPRQLPRWLVRAKEMLEDRFLQVPSLSEVSAIAGVHQVHLSREFRKHFQCTIGEFLRKKRIDYASHLLASTSTSLAQIALTCGFSDQSHFSATFKRMVGITPAKFREMNTGR
jgi:AraC family transcriptional regulator